MTQEEKAKAYDEALKRARKMLNMILDNEILGFPDQIREIFPQLRESEEKQSMTRKEAIDKVYGMIGTAEQHEALDFLVPEVRELRESYDKQQEDERIRKWILEKVQGYVSSGVPCSDEIKMADKAIDYLEKIREKSLIPDELVEGYKKCGLSELVEGAKIVNAINSCYSQNLVLHDTFGYEEGRQTGQNEGVKFVLNNPEKYGLQKPAEWSEEDQENLTWLCRIIHSRVVHKELSLTEESELGKWINKWINHGPKPEQEWDEFDEDCLKRAIWYVENPAPQVVKDSNLVLWLKSLRPSWKPSEEQMEALNALNLYGNLSYVGQQNQLISLYQDLKKLM